MTEDINPDLKSTLDAFCDDFANQRLDSVIGYFSEQAEYQELHGRTLTGKANIRKAFKTLFEGAYGRLSFIPKHTIVNQQKREVCFVWYCQHSLNESRGLSRTNKLIFTLLRLWYGQTLHWEGVDYFIFDDQGKILSKKTYSKTRIPKFVSGQCIH